MRHIACLTSATWYNHIIPEAIRHDSIDLRLLGQRGLWLLDSRPLSALFLCIGQAFRRLYSVSLLLEKVGLRYTHHKASILRSEGPHPQDAKVMIIWKSNNASRVPDVSISSEVLNLALCVQGSYLHIFSFSDEHNARGLAWCSTPPRSLKTMGCFPYFLIRRTDQV